MTIDYHSWYFGLIRRVDSELLLENTPPGTYLVRESETRPGTLSLSIKIDPTKTANPGDKPIRHYNIRRRDSGEYFVSITNNFATISDLIDHYQSNTGNHSNHY